jgi:DNA-binding LacI/PurR family transcriptional regulator
MGAALVDLLEARLAGGGPEHRVLPTHLVVRAST